MKKERTYGVSNQLVYPQRFHQLRADQKEDAASYLGYLEPVTQQALLEDWDARCGRGGIKSEAGYLFRLIELARKKKFRFTISDKTSQNSSGGISLQPPIVSNTDVQYIPASPEIRDMYIKNIYTMLGRKSPKERCKEEDESR